ncbi:hypothetical protein H8S95_09705 [Pontibacter sp. KCTC 32443]|uniref:hypothetical protein n=1 Tax=Pontibacter TaxID=323449 RepID=UPI00164D621D|nr:MULTISPECIES: hypothetical protein [Pontibacter]MBC5774334.1 hypothetical protein [Pontibacter sp. KCTC 32443]
MRRRPVAEVVVRVQFALNRVQDGACIPAQHLVHLFSFSFSDAADSLDADHLKGAVSPLQPERRQKQAAVR